jgi:hypothetical protein
LTFAFLSFVWRLNCRRSFFSLPALTLNLPFGFARKIFIYFGLIINDLRNLSKITSVFCCKISVFRRFFAEVPRNSYTRTMKRRETKTRKSRGRFCGVSDAARRLGVTKGHVSQVWAGERQSERVLALKPKGAK